MKITLEQRNKLIITAAVMVVIIVGIYFFLIRTQLANRKKTESKCKAVQTLIDAAHGDIKNWEELQGKLRIQQQQLQEVEDTMAPASDPKFWMIKTINKFKDRYRIDIPQFSDVLVKEVGTFPEFPFQAAYCRIEGQGHFHELGKFIADFENQFQYFRVQNLEIESVAGPVNPEDVEKLKFKMDIVALISNAKSVK